MSAGVVRIGRVAAAVVAVVAMTVFAPSAGAHTGTPTVSPSSVFTNCDPLVSTGACSNPKTVTVNLTGWPANAAVDLYWLPGMPTTPDKFDCSTVAPFKRAPLGATTVDASGTGEKIVTLPPNASSPPGPETWLYGPNWVCGTSPAGPGANHAHYADRLFLIYPTPF